MDKRLEITKDTVISYGGKNYKVGPDGRFFVERTEPDTRSGRSNTRIRWAERSNKSAVAIHVLAIAAGRSKSNPRDGDP